MSAYDEGFTLGQYRRDHDDYDPRWDFADAAKAGKFREFKEGFEAGFDSAVEVKVMSDIRPLMEFTAANGRRVYLHRLGVSLDVTIQVNRRNHTATLTHDEAIRMRDVLNEMFPADDEETSS